ncbi:MAG TPA: MarR family transcriptional regulator [Pseudonocardiaceae bacterium]|nr:MarR family transcriptional regulator [Pseudonocardiaceae bacterium]
MDSLSAVGVAQELGTNVPRLLRAADRLGLHPARKRGGHLQFGPAEVARLRAELGVTARIGGLRRTQVQVLAALVRAPLGLRSGRAVARAAGLSATAATRALRDLLDTGLVEVRRETVAEGTAKTVEIAYANHTHPRWSELAPQLARVVAPTHARHGRCTVSPRVPGRLAHVFWNAPLGAITLAEHGPYVARRILLDGDTQALAWAAGTLRAADWRKAARGRGIDPRRRALAENLATSAERTHS